MTLWRAAQERPHRQDRHALDVEVLEVEGVHDDARTGALLLHLVLQLLELLRKLGDCFLSIGDALLCSPVQDLAGSISQFEVKMLCSTTSYPELTATMSNRLQEGTALVKNLRPH